MILPQASDELRERMRVRFGDEISEQGPWEYLIKRQWREKAGMMIRPSDKTEEKITPDEWECINFLCDEWDFGYDPKMV